MSFILTAFPGQVVTLVFETLNDGYRSDGYNVLFGTADGYGVDGYYNLPVVERVLFPNLTPASGYPKKWTKIDTGLYTFQFTLPTGSTAVGSYIVDTEYIDPLSGDIFETFFQVICSAPFGQFSVSTF